MRRIVLLILVLGFTALATFCVLQVLPWVNASAAENMSSSLLVSFKDGQIYRMDPTTGDQEPIFGLRYEWYYKRSLSVSPNDTLVAFIERKRGNFDSKEAAREGIYDVSPKLYLRIIDYSGDLVHTIENAQKYAWSPDGNKIAFITYDLKYADYPFRSPTGVWISDMQAGENKKIAEKGQKIAWATFDTCVYFSAFRKVYKWDPKTDNLDSTVYKDLHFSPDGVYYYYLPHPEVGGSIELYERATNKDISHVLPQDVGTLSGWVFNEGHFLLFTRKDVMKRTQGTGMAKKIVSQEIRHVENFIFDVEKRKVVKKFEGKTSPWIGNGKVLVLERDGEVVFERLVPED